MKYKHIPETYMEDSEDTRREDPKRKYVKMYEDKYVDDLLILVKEMSDALHAAVRSAKNRGTQRALIPLIIKGHKAVKNHK